MRDLKALLQQSEREHAERLQKIRSELKSLPPERLEALQMKIGLITISGDSQNGAESPGIRSW